MNDENESNDNEDESINNNLKNQEFAFEDSDFDSLNTDDEENDQIDFIDSLKDNKDNLFESNNNTSDIIQLNDEIDNIDLFKKHMNEKGYVDKSNRFLSKKFALSSDKHNVYNINVSIDNEVVTSITGYDNHNKLVAVPSEIINQVKNDISDSLLQF